MGSLHSWLSVQKAGLDMLTPNSGTQWGITCTSGFYRGEKCCKANEAFLRTTTRSTTIVARQAFKAKRVNSKALQSGNTALTAFHTFRMLVSIHVRHSACMGELSFCQRHNSLSVVLLLRALLYGMGKPFLAFHSVCVPGQQWTGKRARR